MKDEDKKLWNDLLWRKVSPCPDEMTLSAYIDGKLPDDEADAIEMHLAECDSCLDIVSQIRSSDFAAENADHSELNEKVFNRIYKPAGSIATPASSTTGGQAGADKPAIPFNSYRHLKVATLAACFIIIISVVMVMVSINKNKPLSKDAKIARVIELYNNNKFYRLSEDSPDGFEPSDCFSSSTDIMHHIADIDKNGRISMGELLDYISRVNPEPKKAVAGN